MGWYNILSAKNICVVKIAIEICNNNSELKREILCVSGSVTRKHGFDFCRKRHWTEIVEEKTAVILKNLGLPKQLQKEVLGVVLSIGMNMLTWAVYHEETFGFSREYSVNFLNCSFFTQQGIIDNKKAAEELMKDESLNIAHRYKLACLYCFMDHIPALYGQLTKEDKAEFYDAQEPQMIKQPEIVKFWSYHLMGEIDKLKGEKSLDQYRLEKAIASGSKAAVEYCLEKTNVRSKASVIIDAALETVKNRIRRGPEFGFIVYDWIVFEEHSYNGGIESWIPSDYYVDILHFLLSKMRDDQKVEFLRKDIEGVDYEYSPGNHSRTLEYFLNWPYQSYFMKTAELMWEFLPERSYTDLLLKICNRIEPEIWENLKYGEEKSFDYRGLLREFWHQSPKHYKRDLLRDKDGSKETLKEGNPLYAELLFDNLFGLNNFTYKDGQIIELILASETFIEKEYIMSSEVGLYICFKLIRQEKWELLSKFVQNCFMFKERADKFKKELTFMEGVKRICIGFVEMDRWDAAESFMKWSDLSEEEMNKLKKEMIYSEKGRAVCVMLTLLYKNMEEVNKFIRWCFPSEEEAKAFKKELAFSYEGIRRCVDVVKGDQVECIDEFVNFCLSSAEEIKELKKRVAYETGSSVCEKLISDYSIEHIYGERGCTLSRMTRFKGGKWEQVEKLLTWCFSSEEEISEFKNNLHEELGRKIHFNLISANQWGEAGAFFAWLELSPTEIKELKKETLSNHGEASEMFIKLMFSKDGDTRFLEYGSKQEAIELFLRWYLADKETVLKFKNEFKLWHCGGVTEECKKTMFENFDLAIEKCLNDLEEEEKQRGVKRKSEPRKKLCDIQCKKCRGIENIRN